MSAIWLSMSAHSLSKEEAEKAAAAQAVKAGDPVKITAGEFKGSSGTVITFEGQKPYLPLRGRQVDHWRDQGHRHQRRGKLVNCDPWRACASL